MAPPLHDSSGENLGQAKPTSIASAVAVLRELVIELTQQVLSQPVEGSGVEAAHARLRSRLALVTELGYPNKWSRAVVIDREAEARQAALPFDSEDPGHE